MTAEELIDLPDDGTRCELIEGMLVREPPPGFEHGSISMALALRVGSFVHENGLGCALASDTGFRLACDPDTVRAPDFAFVRRDRVPTGRLPAGYWDGAPDLAVEVISPHDRYGAVDLKVQQWLDAGCSVVWVVNPRARTVAVHAAGRVERLRAGETLGGGDVLPGLALPVAELFQR